MVDIMLVKRCVVMVVNTQSSVIQFWIVSIGAIFSVKMAFGCMIVINLIFNLSDG